MFKFMMGADPELFASSGGEFVSAHGLVKGDKFNPYIVEGGAVQVDGMALEFNVNPADNYNTFQDNLDLVLDNLYNMIGNKEFIKDCSVTFSKEFLDLLPSEASVLGCNPDFNAYSGESNKSPDQATLMRTAGGHIHIGGINTEDEWSPDHFNLSSKIARAIDKCVGVYSVLWDTDNTRRSLYGEAGAFRPKKYGVEYRSLSNKWIFSKKITEFIFKETKKAVESVIDGTYIEGGTMYRDIINKGDSSHVFFNNNTTADYIRGCV